MTQKLQNRSTAAIITLCVILLSVLLGASLSLNRARNEVLDVFEWGEDGSWRGIGSDLDEICGNASNLATVAGRYMNENDVLLDAVERAVDALYTARKPDAKAEAAGELKAAVAGLDARLDELELLEEDRIYQEKIRVNIEAGFRTISRSTYNDHARAFNETLKSFPANVLSDITGVEPLELYE